MTVPHINEECLQALEAAGIDAVPKMIMTVENKPEKLTQILTPILGDRSTEQALEVSPFLLVSVDQHALQMCRRLPLVTVRFKPPRLINKRAAVESDSEQEHLLSFLLEVELSCHRLRKSGLSIGTAFAPRFPKIKDENWWLMIGNEASGELHALKRVSIPEESRAVVKLRYLLESETKNRQAKLFLVSDCYLGLDQEYPLIG